MTIAGRTKQFTWAGTAGTTGTTASDPLQVDGAPVALQVVGTSTGTVQFQTTCDPATAAGASGASNWDSLLADTSALTLVANTPQSLLITAPVLAVRLNVTANAGTVNAWSSR